MGNSIITPSMIAKESLMAFKNQLGFTKSVNRRYSKEFAQSGAKVGDTINIRVPVQYEAKDGPVIDIQDTQERSVSLVLDQHKHVGLQHSQKDLTLSIDEFRERYIDEAVIELANAVDFSGYSKCYQKVSNSVGVPSATALPSTLKGFTQAKALMASIGAPVDNLTAIVDPFVEASLVEGLKGLFQSSEQIKQQYEKGIMGFAAGSKFKMSQNVVKHTIGALGGTPAIKTTITAQGAAAIDCDGGSGNVTGYFKKGDVIQIGGVFAVNRRTRQTTGKLMQFVVTADCNMTSNEIASIPIFPAMYSEGPYKNVTALPIDGAAITTFGHASSYKDIVAPQNLVFHKNAFVLGTADFVLPDAGAKAARAVDEETGLSLTYSEQFDIHNYRTVRRLDILFGWEAVNPSFAARVVGEPA